MDEPAVWYALRDGFNQYGLLLKLLGLRSYDEHRNLQCNQYEKQVDEQGQVYLEYTDFGYKANRGGLKHMKVDNKAVCLYENVNDEEHCVILVIYTKA